MIQVLSQTDDRHLFMFEADFEAIEGSIVYLYRLPQYMLKCIVLLTGANQLAMWSEPWCCTLKED